MMILCCTVFIAVGCKPASENGPDMPSETVMANLDIEIFMHDADMTPSASKRLVAANVAANDNEKMHNLRIIIVRPDGTVEHNRFFNLKTAVTGWGSEKFKVVTDEWKKIYLFVNEGLTKIKTDAPGSGGSSPFPVFGDIKVGEVFPEKELEETTVNIGDGSAELSGPLPMNECHRVWMPKQEHSCKLFVTRAAVKFSFVFLNKSGRKDLKIKDLSIDKLLGKEYVMPKNAVYGQPDKDGVREILSFDVPSPGETNNGYYTFKKVLDKDMILPLDSEVVMEPIYLLEGKYVDSDGNNDGEDSPLNYSVEISLDGFYQGRRYFSNLSELPRNTHVAVRAVIGKSNITWTVEPIPYTAIPLLPIFGLD